MALGDDSAAGTGENVISWPSESLSLTSASMGPDINCCENSRFLLYVSHFVLKILYVGKILNTISIIPTLGM